MSAFDRRSVLIGGGATLLGGALAACPKKPEHGGEAGDEHPEKHPRGGMTAAEVIPILTAFADRLIPHDELGPGVKEAGMDTYLERTLADPRMKAIKSLVTRGAVFLQKAARTEHQKPFAALADADKDELIKRMAGNEVRPNGFSADAFVRVMLALSLEGFLGDPRHGGNKGHVGWDFVGGIDWMGRKKA